MYLLSRVYLRSIPSLQIGHIIFSPFLRPQVEKSTAPKPKEEFTGMLGNLAKALDERHKVMHSSGEHRLY